MTRVLLLTQPMSAAPYIEVLRDLAPELEAIEYRPDLDDSILAEVEIALGWRLPAALVPRLPKLRWISSIAAGVEKLLPDDLPAAVRVSRIVDPEQAEGIAQHVVAMALRQVRGLARYDAQQLERRWQRYPMALARPRATVLGTGATGAVVVDWLQRVGFVVRGWNRRSGALAAALADAELVVCALPLTPATESLLDAAAFACMPRGAYLINVARGEHVVEADLITAVRSGHLAGAALDVQRHEPMPAADPLWSVPGITITPHIAAQSSVPTIVAQFVTAWRAWVSGGALPNEVDRGRGY
ncbi:MAG: glyoxylate/hydroxypyruvate reductase A [Pseudomonadota bacterium]|nr:glyoxylate/hydroxypyruvate reductase A [Pseudomonadota bacterium]